MEIRTTATPIRTRSRYERKAMRNSLRLGPSIGALILLLGLTLSSSLADAVQITSLPPVETTDGRVGTCYSFYPNPVSGAGRPFMPLAHDAGSRWDRFDFIWPNLQRPDGSWIPEGIDAYDTLVDDLHNSGFNVVGILLWTPDWAASHGVRARSTPRLGDQPAGWYAPVAQPTRSQLIPMVSNAASSPPRGLYQAWNDWTESDGDPINYWGRFVNRTVARYSDRVKHWEMWNEPEWSYFWTGTSSDYAQLLKVGYEATKAACPDCKVLFGGLHYWENPNYYKWVLNILRDDPEATDNDYFFDIMSVHLYSRSSNTYDVVNDIRSGMTARVPEHPIWLTETGVPVWDDTQVDPVTSKYDYAATQKEAAAYVIQSYANAWAADVARYFFFRTHDADMGEYFGLMRNDRSLRPAYAALQVASSYLISPTLITRQVGSEEAQSVILWGTPRGKVSVVWNETPNPISFDLEAILSTAVLVDQRGVTQTINATGGTYDIDLPRATASLVSDESDYFIGGEPYLIIEEDTIPPSSVTIAPLATTTYSYTIPVSWSAGDGESGIWGIEVQVQEEGTETWSEWLGITDTEHIWSADYNAGEHGNVYCFRGRAWDRAGNIGSWSDEPRCTRLDLDRTVHVSVGAVFGDADSDGNWDTGSGEVALENVSFRLMDRFGSDLVAPTFGASWQITKTLVAGKYAVVIQPQRPPSAPREWLSYQIKIDLRPGETVWELDRPAIGLVPVRSNRYFPLLGHDS
jgi:hypothetical protein